MYRDWKLPSARSPRIGCRRRSWASVTPRASRPKAFADRRLPRIQRDTDAEVRRLLRRARRDVQAAIAAAAAGQQRAWEAGIDTIDRPLTAALSLDASPFDLTAVLPEVDPEQRRAMREFLTVKMRGGGTAIADRINTEIGRAVIGSQGVIGAGAAVRRITGSGRSRALTVVRTELGRAYSVTGQARMSQATEMLPGLRMQWRRSGKIRSRLTHDRANGHGNPV